MGWEAVVAAMVAGCFGGFIREIYGKKGLFTLPRKTEQDWALGGLTSVLCGLAAALLNLAALGPDVTVPVAVSLGIGWGIAFSDIIANAISAAETGGPS
jgi:hypothetical protein